jgi:hypothetical protein
MPSPIADEVKQKLLNLSPDEFASRCILERVPHAFSGSLVDHSSWKSTLGKALEVDPRAMAIVGSAAVGVSLNPNKLLRPFNGQSDFDVAIISMFHFEHAWRALRNLSPRYLQAMDESQRRSIKHHVGKDVYWGTVATDKILELLPFAKQWATALSRMEGVGASAGRTVNARIYRDFEALRSYQLRSIRSAKAELSNP